MKTVGDLFSRVLKDHWNNPRFVASGWRDEVLSLYRLHIEETFGNATLDSITPSRIRAWHLRYKDTPVTGNRALSVLSKVLSFRDEANPCQFVKRHKERKRFRYANEAELKSITRLLDDPEFGDPRSRAFIKLLLFTGARPSAIARGRRDQVRREGDLGFLTLHGKTSSETGEPETVVFSGEALRVLDSVPPPIDGTLLGIPFPRSLWERIREKSGCPDLWGRDLRRTFATVGLSSGIPLDTIAELLGHKSTQTTKIYAKLLTEERGKAASQIAGEISRRTALVADLATSTESIEKQKAG